MLKDVDSDADHVLKVGAARQCREQIVAAIDSGDLNAGDQLPSENELATPFGVGRSSVREAVRTLVVMEYLEVFQGKGTFVKRELPAPDNISDIMDKAIKAGALFDLMETREILECRSAELAAKRATQSQVGKIKKALQQLKKSKASIPTYVEADWDFHVAIAEAANNSVIVDVMNLLINKIHKYNAEFLAASPGISTKAINSAEDIVSHIISGDSEKAGAAMQRHLELIKVEIEKYYRKGSSGK